MSESTGDMASAVEAAFTASSTPEPASTSSTEPSSASTTETPAGDVSQSAASETTETREPGNVPYPRFKEVNDRASTLSKELEAYAWAKGIDPSLGQGAIQLLTRVKANPLALTEELEVLREHPEYGPKLRSWAARTLGVRTAKPAETAPLSMPEPDLTYEDGRKGYSAETMARVVEFLQTQFDAKIDERIQPLASKHEQTERYVADQVYSSLKAKADAAGKSEIDALSNAFPQFTEHKADVLAVMEANPSYTLKQAWAEVFVEKVGPQLARRQADTVTKKVQAGSVNPARQSGGTATAPGSIREHLEQLLGT